MSYALNRFITTTIFRARNSHALRYVFLWHLWGWYAKKKYPKNKGRDQINWVEEIRSRGVAILGRADVNKLAAIADDLLSRESIMAGYCGLPREKNPTVAPLIYAVLEEHKATIERYFGSYFRVNWFEVQKIVEGYDGLQDAGSSFAYHTDDVPKDVMKLFIYLTDTTEASGAFRAFDYTITDELLSAGMLKSTSPGKPRADCQKLVKKDLEEKLIVIEGKKGTVFMFDNNLIHKGTLPHVGARVHVSMELMPNLHPLSYAEFCKDCDQPIREYFPANPFRLRFSK